MDNIEIIIGIIILVIAMTTLLGLTFYSKALIEKIARTGGQTAREVQKGISSGPDTNQ